MSNQIHDIFTGMKNWPLLFIFLLSSFSTFAISPLLKNDREGRSFYIKKRHEKRIEKLLESEREEELTQVYKNTLDSFRPNNICAPTVVEKLKQQLPQDIDLKIALLHMRKANIVDDISLNVLLKVHKLKKAKRKPKVIKLKKDLENQEKVLEAFTQFKRKIERGECIVGLYAQLASAMKNGARKIKSRKIKKYMNLAFTKKVIDEKTFKLIEQARRNKYDEIRVTMADYLKMRMRIRKQFPITVAGGANFVTNKVQRLKVSNRLKLYQTYDLFQIALMSDVILKLRRRLESDKIEIVVHNNLEDDIPEDAELEKIELEPMERFRFAVKLLRKEMHLLATNTLFDGRKPSYKDLMTAAFETGLVPAEEIDEVASMEEIWNPKKTFLEKAMFWIRSAGTIATVLIPPPWGFIPALAIVGIEAATQNKEKANYDHSLF